MLGIPTDPAEAARLAYEGETKLLDVGEVDGKSFVGIASVGFDSDANRIANEAKLVRGNLVYAYAALRALAEWKPARFEVVDRRRAPRGDRLLGRHLQLEGVRRRHVRRAAGRARRRPARRDPLRHHLEVVLPLSYPPEGVQGDPPRRPSFTCFKGETIEVRADRPFVMYADGDPLAELPATVRVRPRSLHVVVPRG